VTPEPYYEEPGITIYCADCRDVLPHLPKVDLVLTDPPYGVGVKYAGFVDGKEELCRLIASTFSMIRKSASVVFLTPGNENIFLYPQPDHILSWMILGGAGLCDWGFTCWHAVLAYGADPYLVAGKGSYPDAWLHQESTVKNGHPCPKPLGIWKRILSRGSVNDSDTILDPFMGSGTTLVAAKQLGRRAIGIEIERKYCDIAIERLRQEVLPLEPEAPQPEQMTL
jgi:site-specific DNA-methyltransferase (adenine-specific)